jgi:hypothetical protein
MLLFHLELEFGFFKKNQFGPFFCEIFLLWSFIPKILNLIHNWTFNFVFFFQLHP